MFLKINPINPVKGAKTTVLEPAAFFAYSITKMYATNLLALCLLLHATWMHFRSYFTLAAWRSAAMATEFLDCKNMPPFIYSKAYICTHTNTYKHEGLLAEASSRCCRDIKIDSSWLTFDFNLKNERRHTFQL